MSSSVLSLARPRVTTSQLGAPWGVVAPGCGQPGMYLMRDGRARFECAAGRFALRPRDIVILPASPDHRIRDGGSDVLMSIDELRTAATVDTDGFRYDAGGEQTNLYTLNFESSDPARRLLPVLVLARERVDRPIQLVMDALFEACAAGSDDEIVTGLSEILWSHALRSHGRNIDARVLRAATSVLANPGAPHCIVDLARIAGLSRSRFIERFVAALGEPPMRFVARARMQRAKELLMAGHSVAWVAEQVGYRSEPAFRRAFRRLIGQGPRAR
ncbi:MAG: AraC family transcriptional regulator [Myxococcota bacterium]